jgi:hypothetical protein
VSESLETIGREFAQSQKRSWERRSQPRQRSWKEWIVMFTGLLMIIVVMGVLTIGILIASGAIKR